MVVLEIDKAMVERKKLVLQVCKERIFLIESGRSGVKGEMAVRMKRTAVFLQDLFTRKGWWDVDELIRKYCGEILMIVNSRKVEYYKKNLKI